jgi:hypothetical protein
MAMTLSGRFRKKSMKLKLTTAISNGCDLVQKIQKKMNESEVKGYYRGPKISYTLDREVYIRLSTAATANSHNTVQKIWKRIKEPEADCGYLRRLWPCPEDSEKDEWTWSSPRLPPTIVTLAGRFRKESMNLKLTAATSERYNLVQKIQKRINEPEADRGYFWQSWSCLEDSEMNEWT